MDFGREVLQWLIANVGYPAVVLSLFVGVAGAIVFFVSLKSDREQRFRRLTAAALPVIILVFVLISGESDDWNLHDVLGGLEPWLRFAIGALAGILVLEMGCALARADAGNGKS